MTLAQPWGRTRQHRPSHGAVVADRQLFMRTLRQLHDQLGTQFRIPMVSGRELDIHLLYKQVRHEHPSREQAKGPAVLR